MSALHTAIIVATAAALAAPALCAAQGPAGDFAQLSTRLFPGDTVWVTDVQGREVKGRIGSITYESIALEGDSPRTFDAGEVRRVRRRDPGRGTGTGAAIGAAVGLGVGIAACAAYPEDDPLRGDACMMAIGLTWMPGLGAGALVGAMFPERERAIMYRARARGRARRSAARVHRPDDLAARERCRCRVQLLTRCQAPGNGTWSLFGVISGPGRSAVSAYA